jgi:hypothetical protein
MLQSGHTELLLAKFFATGSSSPARTRRGVDWRRADGVGRWSCGGGRHILSWRGLRCGGAYVAGRHTLSQQEWFTLGAQLQHFSVYMIPL